MITVQNPEHPTNYQNQLNSSSAPPALEARSIYKTFHDRKQEIQVLDGLSLTVQTGQFVSIIGPSGSGKSTLFHIIGGLTAPDAGSIWMNGVDITGQKGRIAYMPQQPALFPWRTVLDNVLLPRELAGMDQEQAIQEARRWIERAGLSEFEQAYPHTLSGGMQQRTAFLRAMMSPHEVMCLDEPFSALDSLTRSDMQHWLLNIWEENRRSVLMITHHIEEALLLSDTVYVLSSRPAQVLQKIDVPFPRPRREDILSDPAFLEMKGAISVMMREELKK